MPVHDFAIEKNIPSPENKPRRKHGHWVQIARDMSIGDSVLVKKHSEYLSLYRAMKSLGYVVKMRTEDGAHRVWRGNSK